MTTSCSCSLYRLEPTIDPESLKISKLHSRVTGYFSPVLYSRFKYGDGEVANQYATQLAGILMPKLQRNEHFFICGSAYNNVPTAATSIATRLYAQLSLSDYQATYFKVTGQAFAEDYSSLKLKDREKMLSSISLTVGSDIAKKICESTVVVVDDIRVTGLHSQALLRLFTKHRVKKVIFCYAAMVDANSKIHTRTEWTLNHYYVKNLKQLQEVINGGNFEPNARICKFLLTSRQSSIDQFVTGTPHTVMLRLLKLIEIDGYNTLPQYESAYHYLCKHVRRPADSKLLPPFSYVYSD